MEGGDLRSALSGPLAGYNSWYNNGRVLAMDIVRGVFYLHGELSCLTALSISFNQALKILFIDAAELIPRFVNGTQMMVSWRKRCLPKSCFGRQIDLHSQ